MHCSDELILFLTVSILGTAFAHDKLLCENETSTGAPKRQELPVKDIATNSWKAYASWYLGKHGKIPGFTFPAHDTWNATEHTHAVADGSRIASVLHPNSTTTTTRRGNVSSANNRDMATNPDQNIDSTNSASDQKVQGRPNKYKTSSKVVLIARQSLGEDQSDSQEISATTTTTAPSGQTPTEAGTALSSYTATDTTTSPTSPSGHLDATTMSVRDSTQGMSDAASAEYSVSSAPASANTPNHSQNGDHSGTTPRSVSTLLTSRTSPVQTSIAETTDMNVQTTAGTLSSNTKEKSTTRTSSLYSSTETSTGAHDVQHSQSTGKDAESTNSERTRNSLGVTTPTNSATTSEGEVKKETTGGADVNPTTAYTTHSSGTMQETTGGVHLSPTPTYITRSSDETQETTHSGMESPATSPSSVDGKRSQTKNSTENDGATSSATTYSDIPSSTVMPQPASDEHKSDKAKNESDDEVGRGDKDHTPEHSGDGSSTADGSSTTSRRPPPPDRKYPTQKPNRPPWYPPAYSDVPPPVPQFPPGAILQGPTYPAGPHFPPRPNVPVRPPNQPYGYPAYPQPPYYPPPAYNPRPPVAVPGPPYGHQYPPRPAPHYPRPPYTPGQQRPPAPYRYPGNGLPHNPCSYALCPPNHYCLVERQCYANRYCRNVALCRMMGRPYRY